MATDEDAKAKSEAPDDYEAAIKEEEARLKDVANKSWLAARDAVAEFGTAQYNRGHRDGFAEGLEHARKTFMEYIEKGQIKVQPEAPKPPVLPPITMLEPPTSDATTATVPAKELVYDTIKQRPGLRGVELLQEIRRTFPIHERTFRTALFRLKAPKHRFAGPGNIISHEGRWYRFEDAPEDFNSLFPKESFRPQDAKEKGGR